MAIIHKIMKTFTRPDGNDKVQYEIVDDAGRKMIAPDWDVSYDEAFAVGDYVVNDGKLYRFTSAHTAGDAWDDEEVTEITVADEIQAIKSDVSGKASKVSGATSGHFAGLDASGNPTDSGYSVGTGSPSDSKLWTSQQTFTHMSNFLALKADKVTGATENNFAALDANGNLKDSGKKPSDFLTEHQDIGGKADKDTDAVEGNLAEFDGNGNPVDSGKSASDFVASADFYATEMPVSESDSTKVSTALTGLKSQIDDIAEFIPSPNIFSNSFPNTGLIDTSGADSSSSSYMRTDYLPIDSTNTRLYIVRDRTPYIVYICFYDADKRALNNGGTNDRVQLFNSTTTAVKVNTAIPQNAAYYRMATHKTNFNGTLCVSYTSLGSPEPYNVITVIPKTGSLYGKKIAFMGDSIVGNFDDNTGICHKIARKTGANVINCAFGGTRMAYRYGDNIQYTYWNALSGYGLAQAIASGTWTDQETAVENMTGALEYFAARLAMMKTIDWTTIDYIIWEYGTNDFNTEVKVSDTETPTNYYAFDNAYRKAIETILTAYPNIRIIPITPLWRWWRDGETTDFLDDSNTHTTDDYEGTARLLTAFVEKAKEIAHEYQLPYIDDYYTMGANKFTYLHFYDNTDGVHPNAEGRERIAEHIASQLDTVV